MRRRKGVSGGTIFMLVFTLVVLIAAFAVMKGIRRQEGDLAMDAEQLLESVNELVSISRRHLYAEETPEVEYVAVPVASNTAVIRTPAPETVSAVPPVTSAPVTPRQAAATAVPNQRQVLTLTFGGSVRLESSVVNGAHDRETETYSFDEIFSGISGAVHADLNIAVLETVFADDVARGNDLIAPLSGIQTLTAAGFNGVALGTENMLAGGQPAVEDTLGELQKRGIVSVGLSMPESSQRATMLRVNGVQVALLSYTETLSKESKSAVKDESLRNAMLGVYSAERALADISAAKQNGAQAIIVFMHWGSREATAPTKEQKKIVQTLCNAGANIIIGTRSEAVQYADLITAEDGSHETLVAWSLGTLLCEDRNTREIVSGVLLHAQLTYEVSSGRVLISGIEYTPTYSWRQEEDGVQKYRVVISSQPAPQNMIQRQQEQMARARTLIQTTMNKGIGLER